MVNMKEEPKVIPLDPTVEINAMKGVADSLMNLETDSIQRVLSWASSHFNVEPTSELRPPQKQHKEAQSQPSHDDPDYDDIADLFHAANPVTDVDKALVAGYWEQVHEGDKDWTSQAINTRLKHLGHGIKNITDALSGLMNRKPALIIQNQEIRS